MGVKWCYMWFWSAFSQTYCASLHVLIGHLYIFFGEMYIQALWSFLNVIFSFLYLHCRCYLYFLGINHLIRYMICKYFSQFMGCIFIMFIASFDEQVFNFDVVQPLSIWEQFVQHQCNLAAKEGRLECTCMNNDDFTVLVSGGSRHHWVSMWTVWPLLKMTEQVEQWICIKFCIKLEHSSTEITQMIQKAFRNVAMSSAK